VFSFGASVLQDLGRVQLINRLPEGPAGAMLD
jgi:hypothetical protein